MVSIIPGIEALAPERTETNNGFLASPNFLPASFSVFLKLRKFALIISSEITFFCHNNGYMLQLLQ
jgi:hypothetical protein